METITDTKSTITLFDKANSQLQNSLFNIVMTISYAFLPVMNMHTALKQTCTSGVDPLLLSPLLKCTVHHLTSLTSTFGLHKCSASISKCQWVPPFPHGGVQWHTVSSLALPHQTPSCQTAPLLLSVTWQQNVMEYWWEVSTSTVIPPTSASDVMGQHNEIRRQYFQSSPHSSRY